MAYLNPVIRLIFFLFQQKEINTETRNKNLQCSAHDGQLFRCSKTMKRTKNDEAVSPVIGVILMVAITVILAAVVAAFVFGTVGDVKIKKQIAAAASQTVDILSGDYVTTVTYHGGKDFRDLSALEATITVPGGTPDSGFTWNYASMGTAPVPVGTTGTIPLGSSGADHVIVVATFVDGSKQLILDTFV